MAVLLFFYERSYWGDIKLREISVIIPIYNIERYKDIFIDRIKQIERDDLIKEIIMIEDSSTDKTKDILEQYLSDYSPKIIILFNQFNSGPAYSRNVGIKIASGNYIAFLDSDDNWHPHKTKIQIELMKESECLISGTRHVVLEEKQKIPQIRIGDIDKKKISWPAVLFSNPFCTPSVILHSSLINKYLFDNKLKYSEDFNLWIKIIREHDALLIQEPLTFTYKHDYLGHTGSLSSNLVAMQKGELKSLYSILIKTRSPFVILAIIYSCIKYLRRILISKISRINLGAKINE